MNSEWVVTVMKLNNIIITISWFSGSHNASTKSPPRYTDDRCGETLFITVKENVVRVSRREDFVQVRDIDDGDQIVIIIIVIIITTYTDPDDVTTAGIMMGIRCLVSLYCSSRYTVVAIASCQNNEMFLLFFYLHPSVNIRLNF